MKTKSGIKKMFCGMIIVLALTIFSGNTLTANAASYKTLYKNVLKRGKTTVYYSKRPSTITMEYFAILNIDKKGAPELLVSSNVYSTVIDVFTIKNGKVKYVDNIMNKYMGIKGGVRYNPSKKGLVLANGGSAAEGLSLWRLSKGTLKESKSVIAYFNRKVTYQYNWKNCSAKTYKKYRKKYFSNKQIKTIRFVKNSKANRNRKVK